MRAHHLLCMTTVRSLGLVSESSSIWLRLAILPYMMLTENRYTSKMYQMAVSSLQC